MRRDYPERPLVGVLGVVRRAGEVLLVERARPPFVGQWGFPGGAQELGETVFAATARELFEETRLRVEPVAILTVLDTILRDPAGLVRTHWTLLAILAEWRAGEVALDAEASEFGWFTPAALAERRLPLMDAVERLAALALGHPRGDP